MIFPIRLYRIKRILGDQRAFFISLILMIMLFGIVTLFYIQFNTQLKEVELMKNETVMLKNRFDTLKYNKTLTEDQVKVYNKLLASLVPETEDYFSIIYAIEEISKASQFVITDYTIDVAKKNQERLTLSVEGQGDTDAFLAFLQEYQFAGGRLATIDKIQYGGLNVGRTRIALNFYSKRFTFNESVQVPQFNREELDKLDAIKAKVKFQFSSAGDQSTDTRYESKKNPFIKE